MFDIPFFSAIARLHRPTVDFLLPHVLLINRKGVVVEESADSEAEIEQKILKALASRKRP